MFIPDFSIPDPGSKIPDPHQRIYVFLTQKTVSKISEKLSGMFIPDPGSGSRFFSLFLSFSVFIPVSILIVDGFYPISWPSASVRKIFVFTLT
jgi:hypothetical protein